MEVPVEVLAEAPAEVLAGKGPGGQSGRDSGGRAGRVLVLAAALGGAEAAAGARSGREGTDRAAADTPKHPGVDPAWAAPALARVAAAAAAAGSR